MRVTQGQKGAWRESYKKMSNLTSGISLHVGKEVTLPLKRGKEVKVGSNFGSVREEIGGSVFALEARNWAIKGLKWHKLEGRGLITTTMNRKKELISEKVEVTGGPS